MVTSHAPSLNFSIYLFSTSIRLKTVSPLSNTLHCFHNSLRNSFYSSSPSLQSHRQFPLVLDASCYSGLCTVPVILTRILRSTFVSSVEIHGVVSQGSFDPTYQISLPNLHSVYAFCVLYCGICSALFYQSHKPSDLCCFLWINVAYLVESVF